MIPDFIDPDPIQREPATVSAIADIPLVDPATARRFQQLDQFGAVAYLDRLGHGDPMMPGEALSAVEAMPRDGGRQVAIQPRRGPAFLIPLHRGRHGLVYAQSWT